MRVIATSERQKLSRGKFCPATSICLFWPTGNPQGQTHTNQRSPHFLAPATRHFSHATKGKSPFSGYLLQMAIFFVARGKNRMSFNVPLALGCTLTGVKWNGGVAYVGASWRVLVHFCTFLRFSVRFCAFFSCQYDLQKERTFAQNHAKMCTKKTFLCNTRFSYTPFCVSPMPSKSGTWVLVGISAHPPAARAK